MKYEIKKLKNGTEVIVVHDSKAKKLILSAFIKAGSLYESKENNGISHFIEHLLFKGTENYPSGEKFLKALDKNNISYFAETRKEFVYFEFRFRRNSLKEAVVLFSEMLSRPLFDEKEVKIEKGVVLEEIRDSALDIDREFISKTNKTLFGHKELSLPTLGNIKTLNKISRAGIHKFWQKHYSIKNSVICFGGDIETSEILSLLEKNLKMPKGRVAQKAYPGISLRKFSEKKSKNAKLKNRAIFSWNFILPKATSDDFYSSFLLNTIVNKRLNYLIRERKGLSYNVEASWTQFKQFGVLDISLWLEKNKLAKVREAIFEEIESISISSEELLLAKNKAKDYFRSVSHDVINAAYYLGEQRIIREGEGIIDWNQAKKKIDNIKLGEFKIFAEKILSKDKSMLFIESQ